MNLLLHKITEAKIVHTLDILGLKVPDRVFLKEQEKEKHLHILECASIYFTHIYSEQASCQNKNIFHFMRHINEVNIIPVWFHCDEVVSVEQTGRA